MFEEQFYPVMVVERNDGSGQGGGAIASYHFLTGMHPADADTSNDFSFDRHVLACILAAGVMEGGRLFEKVGLSSGELAALLKKNFPSVRIKGDDLLLGSKRDDNDEVTMVRDLLLAQRSTEGDTGRWLAAMIARRVMEPNHLWADLGLRDRGELSRVLNRHFGPLARRNVNNMRWKRFFYRTLCEDEGLILCTTPVCTECKDFNFCFGDESGESRMAERRRDGRLVPAAPVAGGS
ncbi:nitrogen fixation protein NifQ [Bradyrhizobium diazoefficiens]|uniref:nitrogen fixation protein NifQ n=1 Tax=Bradyrhizobium diazoefficiens TaxID=1355477 RepID=UPI001FEFC1FE|nr:nitrogen fixation protein NifQ [Bradyrhizobium diazoefficiens]